MTKPIQPMIVGNNPGPGELREPKGREKAEYRYIEHTMINPRTNTDSILFMMRPPLSLLTQKIFIP